MDVGARFRRDVAKSMHMRHHVMTERLFVCCHGGKVDVALVGAHCVDRDFRNFDAQTPLRFSEREPQLAPQPITRFRAPERKHGARGVPFGQR